MKKYIVVILLLLFISTNFIARDTKFDDFKNNEIIFNNSGFDYRQPVSLYNSLNYYFLIDDKMSYFNLYLNFNRDKYSNEFDYLFDKNSIVKTFETISFNFDYYQIFLGDVYSNNYYFGSKLSLNNRIITLDYKEIHNLNHELSFSLFFNMQEKTNFNDDLLKFEFKACSGIIYDLDWNNENYVKTSLEIKGKKNLFNFVSISNKSEIENTLINENVFDIHIPTTNLRSSFFNYSTNNYFKNSSEINLFRDFNFLFPMRSSLGIFAELLYMSDDVTYLFNEDNNIFTGIFYRHEINQVTTSGIFSLELGLGRYYNNFEIQEELMPYFNINFNYSFALITIGAIIAPFIVSK